MEQVLLYAALALKLFTVYFAVVFLLGALKKTPVIPRHAPETRFAVVIAARNEGAVIGGLVRSLRRQDYPAELCDVYVAPNNCTDDTAARAAAAGARVFLPQGTVTCKGDALSQVFDHLMGEEYDAFLVFDADNVVDPQFLQRCNDAFCAGARVVKGRHLAQRPESHWLAGCYDIYFRAFDFLFNRPRAALGLSCKLVGTGFGFRREVLAELGGWSTGTIAEDAEFSAHCAARGIRVTWVPEARTYDEQPGTFRQSLIQRRRWCSGVMQVAQKEAPALIRGSGDVRFRRDMTCFLLTPYAQAFSFLLTAAATLLSLPAGGVTLDGVALTALGAYGGLCLAALALLRLTGGWKAGMGRAVLMFPVFMATWMPLQLLALVKKTAQWRAIPHTARMSSAAAAD